MEVKPQTGQILKVPGSYDICILCFDMLGSYNFEYETEGQSLIQPWNALRL